MVVRWETGEWKYLFLRAYANWDFPKGVVESGEDPLEAAKREIQEETGIQDLQFRWGYRYCETAPYSGGKKVARYYLAETRSSRVVFSVNPEIGRPEHHEYRWLSYSQLKEMTPDRLKPVVRWAARLIGADEEKNE